MEMDEIRQRYGSQRVVLKSKYALATTGEN